MPVIAIMAFPLALLMLYLAIRAYRSIYPLERVLGAMEVVAEYRSISSARRRSKRLERRLKSLEPDYRRARGLLFRTLIVKFLLLSAAYVSVGLMLTLLQPLVASPYYIPLVTERVEIEGAVVEVIPILYIHFFAFMYAVLLYRNMLV